EKKGELSSDGLDRSILWKKAREDKNGNIPHDATKERVEKIDKLTEQVNEGSLVTSGSNDILTLVLGTAEQSGNVRGMGKMDISIISTLGRLLFTTCGNMFAYLT
ncbi:hypothetical protein MKW92_041154, partial [Papaver armeniacum]